MQVGSLRPYPPGHREPQMVERAQMQRGCLVGRELRLG